VNPAISPTPSTAAAAAGAGPLPTVTVGAARLPAAVRNGSPAVKQAYSTAQNFEEMLLQQLSQSLVQSSGLAGEGSGGGEEPGETGASADGGMLTSMLPQTLAEGVMRSGGLGLAAQLTGALDPSADRAAGSSAIASTGGLSA
jgi:Rod binding domain-containing protein